MLERFLFDRQRQWDPIRKLSGGERRRLYLLRVLMEQPNVLLLDEPTNDLDVETLTVLEDYLESFEGVVIVVSHDRYFLDRTVDHLLVFQEDNSVVEFPGGYSDWLERKREDAAAAAAERKLEEEQQRSTTSARPNESKRLSYMEQRELDALGPKMAELEEALEAIDQEMAERHDDYTLLQELTERKQAVSAELDEALERWMELEEKQGNA
jgi:ATP-binding cassette subfamily F protein uup